MIMIIDILIAYNLIISMVSAYTLYLPIRRYSGHRLYMDMDMI